MGWLRDRSISTLEAMGGGLRVLAVGSKHLISAPLSGAVTATPLEKVRNQG